MPVIISSNLPTTFIDFTNASGVSDYFLASDSRRLYIEPEEGGLGILRPDGNLILLESLVSDVSVAGSGDTLGRNIQFTAGAGISLTTTPPADPTFSNVGDITIAADVSELVIKMNGITRATNPTSINFHDFDNIFVTETPSGTAKIDLSTYGLLGSRFGGQTWTGDNSFTASLSIPNSTSPTVDASGEIAIDTDTDNSNITQGSLVFCDGTRKMYGIAVDTLPSLDKYVLSYDGTNKKYTFQSGTSTTSFSRIFSLMGA